MILHLCSNFYRLQRNKSDSGIIAANHSSYYRSKDSSHPQIVPVQMKQDLWVLRDQKHQHPPLQLILLTVQIHLGVLFLPYTSTIEIRFYETKRMSPASLARILASFKEAPASRSVQGSHACQKSPSNHC